MNINIESTADGSVTLYRPDIDEHYHSIKGALAESIHVYLKLGWEHFSSGDKPVRVFEVGFGTGLNAALTARAAKETERLTEYIAVELFPVSNQLTESLLPCQPEELSAHFDAVNSCEWNIASDINPYFRLHKLIDDLTLMDIPENIGVVYFDAFAPEKQPEMWEEQIFSKIFNAMVPGGILTTYCAKGVIRRLLQKVGFTVERLSGPPQGKREVLRATKPLI